MDVERKSRFRTEVCAGSVGSCAEALRGGADRVELCAALEAGGLTPSAGAIAAARELPGLTLHVLVRPREGDFLYTRSELAVMERDIAAARDGGADGVVVGCLDADGSVDMAALRRLMRAARGLSVTFHRAFDHVRDPLEALERIVDAGCDRILTSGCRPTAQEGIPLLACLVERAAGRITVMPGCGIGEHNVARIALETGAEEFHFSARLPVPSRMRFRNPDVHMGEVSADDYSTAATSADRVARIVRVLRAAAL